MCFNNIRELKKKEKKYIMKESHANHLGERNTLERARKVGIWLAMYKEIIDYVKKCPECQLQKTTRIKNQMESVSQIFRQNLMKKLHLTFLDL